MQDAGDTFLIAKLCRSCNFIFMNMPCLFVCVLIFFLSLRKILARNDIFVAKMRAYTFENVIYGIYSQSNCRAN